MRSESVSMPWVRRKALNGERAAPVSRSRVVLILYASAAGPNASVDTRPWYEGWGSVSAAILPLFLLKLPPSAMIATWKPRDLRETWWRSARQHVHRAQSAGRDTA